MKIIFLGTPNIACNALSELAKKDDIEIEAVITQPDKPAGRGRKLTPPPVKDLAEKLELKVYQPISIRKDAELINLIKSILPDFLITIAFGQILSQEILDIPKYGTVNLHASLLPKYRGPNPMAQAIANGDTYTGVTTMLTSLGVDEGDIVLTERIEIPKTMTIFDLATKVSNIAPEILHKSLIGLRDKTITPIAQNHSEATFAPKFSKEETVIDFNKSAEEIHNKVRALYPRANAYYNGSLIKIITTEVIDENANNQPGKMIRKSKDGIFVACNDKVILIKTVKPEGKKEMPASAWACGLKELGNFTNN